MKKTKTNKGITLIALIITIIILLILAMVSINLVMNGGIISKAEYATEQYTIAQEKEQIQLGYTAYKMSALGTKNPKLTVEGAEVLGDEYSGWSIKFTNTGKEYELSSTGDIEEIEEYGPVVNDENPEGWKYAWISTSSGWDETKYTDGIITTTETEYVAAKFYEKAGGKYKLVIEGKGEAAPLAIVDSSGTPTALYAYQKPLEALLTGGTPTDALILNVTEVLVCDGVTNIPFGAFAFSSSLTELKISKTVEKIEALVLQDTSLQNLTIPNGIIADNAFASCVSLTNVTLGNGVTSIGKEAFSNCRGITTFKVPNSVTEIGERAFYNCRELQSLTIGAGVTTMGKEITLSCLKLANLTLVDGIKTIGERAFYERDLLTTVRIPGSVTSIGEFAFYCCRGLTNLILEEGIQTIGESAFSNCSDALDIKAFTKVTIPKSVTDIKQYAFSDNSSLSEVDWKCESEQVNVGSYAFWNIGYPSFATIYVRNQAIKTAVEASSINDYTTVTVRNN